MNHWLILPILIPALMSPLIVLLARHDIIMTRVFSLVSIVAQLVVAATMVSLAAQGEIYTYTLGNWLAPFGIVLVLDRLSAMMVLLAAVLGFFVLLYSISSWDLKGRHFHSLFQFQMMGINGAFLTGDFFNLFVFFEVMLIASYGLMVHGGGAERLRAGLQYVMINLFGSAIFLLGVGLIYSVTGTLNMADLSFKIDQLDAAHQAILQVGSVLLLIVFALKAAVLPFHFWLPGTYQHAPGPIAALFAIMTKVGAYAILRIFSLAFAQGSSEMTWFAGEWLLPSAMVGTLVGAFCALGSRSLAQMLSFAVISSMGTLFIALSILDSSAWVAALYYMAHSTLAAAAMFLIIDLLRERRIDIRDGIGISGPFPQPVLLGFLFMIATLAVVGLPPLSGFLGKIMILQSSTSLTIAPWIWSVILISSWFLLVAFARAGSLIFWKSATVEQQSGESVVPRNLAYLPVIACFALLATLLCYTAMSNLVVEYLAGAAEQMIRGEGYIDAVLGQHEGYIPWQDR